jgi:hypothetical protein
MQDSLLQDDVTLRSVPHAMQHMFYVHYTTHARRVLHVQMTV